MRIEELILETSNLKGVENFYHNIFSIPIEFKSTSSISFKIGTSTLTFHEVLKSTPYHFAINISSHKETEALNWVKKRIKILPYKGNDIADFKSWNAKSFYFYDTDFNIVEFIARRNLNLNWADGFNENHLFGISEIGMPVEDVAKTFQTLNDIQKLEIFDGNLSHFCAAGDEHGLFIIINKHLKKWIPTNDKADSSPFTLKGDFNIRFNQGKIRQLQ